MRPYVVDLFCGAGGAARGYYDAGFQPIGVDIKPQPNYPYQFIHDDALEVLGALMDGGCYELPPELRGGPLGRCVHLSDLAAIHASPPCQHWSAISKCKPGLAAKYPDLITPLRPMLYETGLPYVIENVPGAPLVDPVTLCGSHFGLNVYWPEKQERFTLRRHREFESNFPIPDPGPHDHSLRVIPVYGHGQPGNYRHLRGKGFTALAREVMGIDWTTRDELTEAIPPAYTHYIGSSLMLHLRKTDKDRMVLAA